MTYWSLELIPPDVIEEIQRGTIHPREFKVTIGRVKRPIRNFKGKTRNGIKIRLQSFGA